MSAKYRKIDPRIWRDEGFCSLSENEKLVAFYLLTSHQCNRIGLFNFSPAMAAEELETSPQTFRGRFDKVCQTFHWRYDEKAKVVYIGTWWKYNRPENPNVFKACLEDLHDLPKTHLISEFCANTKFLPDGCVTILGNVSANVAANVPPNVTTNQEQEQEQYHEQEQEQEYPPITPQKILTPCHDPQVEPKTKKAPSHLESIKDVEVPEDLDSEEFRAALDDLIHYRRESGKPMTPRAYKMMLTNFAKYGHDAAVWAMSNTVMNQWQGVFPEKYIPPKKRPGELPELPEGRFYLRDDASGQVFVTRNMGPEYDEMMRLEWAAMNDEEREAEIHSIVNRTSATLEQVVAGLREKGLTVPPLEELAPVATQAEWESERAQDELEF